MAPTPDRRNNKVIEDARVVDAAHSRELQARWDRQIAEAKRAEAHLRRVANLYIEREKGT